MKKQNAILFASALGFFAVAGFLCARLFLRNKQAGYQNYYGDFHQNLAPKPGYDDNYGIEYL